MNDDMTNALTTAAETYKVYSFTATDGRLLWSYVPRDYDDSFEPWAGTYATEAEAVAASEAELADFLAYQPVPDSSEDTI